MPPHLDGLKLAPFTGERPEETERFTAGTARDVFTDDRAAEIIKQTLAHPEFRERLVRTRWSVIGAARRSDAKDDGRRFVVVVAYDYSHDVVVEATVDEASGKFLSFAEAVYQPPPSAAEIDRAAELARGDERIARQNLSDLVMMAIPLDPSAAGVPGANHRVVEVLFGCRQERLPRYRAIVDLSAERVVWAGDTSACCGQTENRQ
jgi:hypothetical protein